MNDFNQSYGAPNAGGTMDMATDAGLRSFMLGVYNKLALGLALAGALAMFVGTNQAAFELVMGTPLRFVVQFGPLALIFGSMFFMKNPSPLGSSILYWSIVALIGVGLSVWVYMASAGLRGISFTLIAKAFFITASAFGALSLFGYTTKRNLGPIGTFAIMAIWGVVALSVVSMLFQSQALANMKWLEYGIMAVVFIASAVIVAWQTQELKEGYYALGGDTRGMAVMTNWGALNFFISFVNMFQVIMSVMSSD